MRVEVNRAKISVRLQKSLCKGSFPEALHSSKLRSLAFPMREEDDDVELLTLRQKELHLVC